MFQCGAISPLPILSYITASISGVLCLITVPGNLLICMAVYIDPYHRLRTPFNIVVANLAFADLIVGCITEPLSVYLHIKEGLGREITVVEIRAIHLSYFISCTASVLSISLLALERYMSISYSFKYKLYFKVRRFVLVSVIVWLVAVGLSTVYILTNYVFYTFVFINIAVFWTLGVTTFCYVKILRKLKKVEKRMKKSTVIGNTNPILENVSPLSKPYVVKVKENVTTYLQDKQRGVTNNESNMKRGGSQIEENINGKESCSSELGHSSSYEIEADNITNSSIENDKGVNNSESNAGFDPNEENVHEKDSPNQIEESGQNSALPQLGDDHCFRKIKKESNGDERIDTNQENTPEKDSAFLQLGTAHDVCKTNVATYNEQTSNKYNILVTKTYIIVSLIFLACYIPALLIIYTMNWCHTCSCTAIHIMRDLQFIIVIVNSSVNPFLYSIRFPHFRRAISKILQDIRDEVLY
ncbi:histamine H2 receptor-like [Paramuricea clavata]|uniref:Histamine H2 receptor-like n=2 Tax=Paramuricea clavata TaxID=317549 RepID=A0A6S7KS27_PARCT|nr:histamine H2 receptor-like [Paramuricea clavata]